MTINEMTEALRLLGVYSRTPTLRFGLAQTLCRAGLDGKGLERLRRYCARKAKGPPAALLTAVLRDGRWRAVLAPRGKATPHDPGDKPWTPPAPTRDDLAHRAWSALRFDRRQPTEVAATYADGCMAELEQMVLPVAVSEGFTHKAVKKLLSGSRDTLLLEERSMHKRGCAAVDKHPLFRGAAV